MRPYLESEDRPHRIYDMIKGRINQDDDRYANDPLGHFVRLQRSLHV